MTRLAVIGGDAGGMSCAAMVRRLDPAIEIVTFERGPYTSYSACGIPYYVGGWIAEAHDLVLREAERHRDAGIDVRLGWEVTELDLDARRLTARHDGDSSVEGFDLLLYATGAEAVVPDLPGAREATEPLKTIPAAERFRTRLAGEHGSSAVVVGGGYIGLEIAEALAHRGNTVTLVEAGPEVFPTLDPDMGAHVRRAAERAGIEVRCGVPVAEIEQSGGVPHAVVLADGSRLEARHVVVAVGARPAVGLAEAAGLPMGQTGALAVDDRMRAGDGVFAAGDCVESWHRLLARPVNLPLGTHANRQGRVAAQVLCGRDARFPGVIGTAISRICSAEVARTGLSEREAGDAGMPYVTATIESTTKASYFPGARPIWIKLLAAPGSGRLLGGQIVGGDGAGKRIDVLAAAIWAGMSAEDLADADLSYAPPFSGVFDPVSLAARQVAKAARGA